MVVPAFSAVENEEVREMECVKSPEGMQKEAAARKQRGMALARRGVARVGH
jgi:hypothetical protein